MVTFVSLLMFLQLGVSQTLSTLLSAILFLPWVLKSFIRTWVRRAGYFRHFIHVSEALLAGCLFALAASFHYGVEWVFLSLFGISMLCAWHELLARMYYECMLRPKLQDIFNTHKVIYSHVAVIFTYGALILMVGSMEVFFRHIRRAWAMGCYLTAGLFLFFAICHLFLLRSPSVEGGNQHYSVKGSVQAQLHVLQRIRHQKGWWVPVIALFFLLLPQSLMFYTRVLFLLDTKDNGGLHCTIQEVGFAQGTVGVLAFCLGITIGRGLLKWIPVTRIFWPLAIALGLSPAIYLLMTIEPPSTLGTLSMASFQAQLLFGMGLCVCRVFVKDISGDRYRNTVNLLYVPLIAFCMIVPMAASGWLAECLGYRSFFLLDAVSAPLGWGLVCLCRRRMCK